MLLVFLRFLQLPLNKNFDFFQLFGSVFGRFGEGFRTFLEDCWAGVWGMFGTVFEGFGELLGKVSGRLSEVKKPFNEPIQTNKTLLNPGKVFFRGVVGNRD